ncbi:TAXI family TRAP transporter solute-binding subunit [Roseovarius sp. CAU 1744]|uniref:TAXI family TRAP transporter solute-binding subunit n=1 Tax=Roseovarius sp. CAU 1744 TaxID=3140368 RepID=UPI00325BDDD1
MRKSLVVGAVLAALCGGAAMAEDGLPATMIWTTYHVGSAGHSEASAIADALGKQYGTRVRIQPSSSAIGRIDPVLQGRAHVGFLGNEVYFASEGIYDYATPDRGPQPVRAIAGRLSSFVIATAKDAGISQVEDLRGKRFAMPIGNSSVNSKCAAMLAFGGLSYDDLELLELPAYKDTISAMTEGRADAACVVTTTGGLYELAESPRGISYVPLPADNAEGWERMSAVLPILSPYKESVGAGLKDGDSIEAAGYRYPVLTVRTDMSVDEVYALTKAMDETFEIYKDATFASRRWSLDQAATPPIDAPFHEGAVKYLTEKGMWSEEAEAWNKARIERETKILAEWEAFAEANKDLSEEAFKSAWHDHRADLLK